MNRREKKQHAKKKERERRLAQAKHVERSQSVPEELADEASDELSIWEEERLLRHVAREAPADAAPTEAELEALVEALFERDADELADAVRRDPREFAQELAFQAFEEGSRSEALALAQLALEHDPACVDALALRALFAATSNAEALAQLERAVSVATRRLAGTGGVRALVERRPYLRTRHALANELLNLGRFDEGLAQYEALLDVDPNQYLDARHELVAHALALNDTPRAQRVIARYAGELTPCLRWAAALAQFSAGDRAGAAAALERARAANTWVEGALLGETVLHPDLENDGPGTQAEAEWIVEMLEGAWAEVDGALQWLGDGGLATTDPDAV